MNRRKQIEEALKQPREKLKLELAHHHFRDERIVFLSHLHLYIIDGNIDDLPISATGFKEQFFPKFDSRRTFLYSKNYIGRDQAQVKQEWNNTAARGTYIHRQIELYLNELPCDTDAAEMKLFLRWRAERPDWKPIRTEMSLFAKNIKLAGQFDALFKRNGCWILVDWKVSLIRRSGFCWCEKEEKKEPGSDHSKACERFGSHPLTQDLEAHALNQYTLQLNIYRLMLKHLYNINVQEMYLVALKDSLHSAETIRAPIWEELTEALFRYRAEQTLGIAYNMED